MNSQEESAQAPEAVEIAFLGGGTTVVTRVGETVRRPLYRFAPLSGSLDPSDPLSSLDVQAARARGFLDAYGCTPDQRSSTVATLVPRLEALVALMRTRAGDGDENFARHIEEGHLALYLRDIDYIRSNEQHWRAVVGEPPTSSAEEDEKR